MKQEDEYEILHTAIERISNELKELEPEHQLFMYEPEGLDEEDAQLLADFLIAKFSSCSDPKKITEKEKFDAFKNFLTHLESALMIARLKRNYFDPNNL